MNNYEPVVGMEIHVELKTNSKMFCGCKNDPFHAPNPNIYTCPVCLGMPGGLPVANKKAVEWTIMLGLALGCEITEFSKFDRKNYFYPDLPKGYQISQYDEPIATNGSLKIQGTGDRGPSSAKASAGEQGAGEEKIIRINRVHLEEDTAKLYHQTVDNKSVSLIDFNRSGVPLVEIVTEPDIHSGEEARVFLKKLHQVIRYLGISDADMEKGSMRLEPNISVRKLEALNPKSETNSKLEIQNSNLPPYKVEVKNINSFNFVKKAIEFETKRHIEILENGEMPAQETRGWNEDKGITFAQRSKEKAQDYRYFPEPDIPPLRFTEAQISNIKSQIPELPEDKKARFVKKYKLNEHDAEMLTENVERAEFYERSVEASKRRSVGGKAVEPKTIANWIINKKVDTKTVKPEELVEEIVKATTVEDVPEEELAKAIESVIAANEKAAADFKAGKEQSFMFLFGQTIRTLGGKGDKQKIQDMLRKKLGAN